MHLFLFPRAFLPSFLSLVLTDIFNLHRFTYSHFRIFLSCKYILNSVYLEHRDAYLFSSVDFSSQHIFVCVINFRTCQHCIRLSLQVLFPIYIYLYFCVLLNYYFQFHFSSLDRNKRINMN